MEFKYVKEMIISLKSIFRYQKLFWAIFLVGLIMMFLVIISGSLILGEAFYEGSESWGVTENMGNYETLSAIFNYNPPFLITLIIISLSYYTFIVAGGTTWYLRYAKERKGGFRDFFNAGSKKFVRFLPLVLILTFIQLISGALLKNDILVNLITFIISYFIMFSGFAISDGKGPIRGIIYSLKGSFTKHRFNTFLSVFSIAIVLYVGWVIVLLLSAPLIFFGIGILMIIFWAYIFMLLMLGLTEYVAKCYLMEAKTSQPLETPEQSSDLPASNSGPTQ